MARAKPRSGAVATGEPAGLWHQPALMNMLADMLIVLAVAGLSWAGWTALQRLPVFPLRELVLGEAPLRVSVDQIEHAARGAVVGNFFTVDLEAARTGFEKLPWVRKAAVRRQWPDGLSVVLEEHVAVGRWRHLNGDAGLVNAQGEVFGAELPEGAEVLPQLSGPEGSAAEILARHAEFGGALAGIGRRVEALSLSPRRAWRLELDDGVVIELGRDQGRHLPGERLERFAAHYDGLRRRFGAARVADMRYPNGFVLSGIEATVRTPRKESAGRKS